MKTALDSSLKVSAPQVDDMVVRRAQLADLSAIMDIEHRSFSSPWSEQTLHEEITGKEWSKTVVAALAEKPLGFMIYWIVVNELHLLNLAVHPDVRCKGIGTLLLGHLIDVARIERVDDIFLEVRVSNRRAQVLYHQFGFKPVGIRRRYYADNGEDAIVMCRRRD